MREDWENNNGQTKKPSLVALKIANRSPVTWQKKTAKLDSKSNKSLRPKWRFQKRDVTHEHWHLEITEELLKKLAHFETMTWSQILITAKKQNHHVETHNLSKPAQKRLIELRLDDYTELCSLRLGGKHRLYGILDTDGTFSIIWNDRKHEICPSIRKHT